MAEGLGVEQVQAWLANSARQANRCGDVGVGIVPLFMAVVLLLGPGPGVGGTERSSMA
jgi:hypothetical protein